MTVNLDDLLTPVRTIGCPVAAALAEIDKTYRGQLEAAIALIAATPARAAAPVPQTNVIEAFRRLGQTVSDHRLRDHVRGRCACA